MNKFNENGAQSANDVANSNVSYINLKDSKKGNGRQKRPAIPVMWQILKKAHKTFSAQLVKTNESKRECIEMYQSAEMNDSPRFWGEFMKQVDKLLDNRKYLRECRHLDYDAVNVAEHIVFRGSATVNKVLRTGVQNVVGHDLMLYGERLSPKEADVFREKITNLLAKEQGNGKQSEIVDLELKGLQKSINLERIRGTLSAPFV